MSNRHLNAPSLSDIDVLAFLDELIPDTLETRTVGAQEWLRLKLTEVMMEARKRAGLTQAELAERLGVGQARISKLENANNDRTIDSVVAYLTALDAELLVAVRQGEQVFQASRDCWLVDIPHAPTTVELHSVHTDFEVQAPAAVRDLAPAPVEAVVAA